MVILYAPIRVIPTVEAARALGDKIADAGRFAFKAIAAAGTGLDVAHLQFAFSGTVLAVCSRLKGNGVIEIEVGIGDRRLPADCIPASRLRADRRGGVDTMRRSGVL